ncbi:MAG: selenocysteine-specific translation elongation factor [Deltaproteobacteria bacterium]|nr:selenocysteine-specific translation elongation factor [Deltaproteobacteria bacterium]
MREIILGTAGHVDHGKTSLIKALTGIDTDRLKEEKERGITIELGFAFLDLPCGHRLGIVDVPGHEKFVKNMVAGASGMDLVAFIIAADEGIMPQTREHFEICRLLGIKRGIIVITKKDMVEPDWLELVTDDVRTYFAGSFLEDAPLIPVSSTTGEGIEEVRNVLDALVAASGFSEPHGPFRMPVDRVFSMKGFGTVITGTAISGRIKTGEDLMFYPGRQVGKIRGMQVHNVDTQEAEAGHRTAINLQGLEKESINRGEMAAAVDCLQPSYLLDGRFIFLESNKKPYKNRSRVRVHAGTAEIMARIVLLEDEELAPGSEANVQILLEEQVGCWPGDKYVVRSYSPISTIGGGIIYNGSPRKRKRFRPINKEIFKTYSENNPEELVLLHIQENGYNGLTLEKLAVKTGIFGKRLNKILQLPISSRKILVVEQDKQRMVSTEVYQKLIEKFSSVLTEYHKNNPLKAGLPKEELRSLLYRGLDQRLFQFLLNDLQKKKVIVQDQALIRMADHRISMKDEEVNLRRELEVFYNQAGLAPPTLKEVMAKFGRYQHQLLKEVLTIMMNENQLVKVSEDLYFYKPAVENLKEKLVALLAKENEIDMPKFKDLTGLSRKFSVPLLEYFDRIKVTIRVGDKRILRERQNQ